MRVMRSPKLIIGLRIRGKRFTVESEYSIEPLNKRKGYPGTKEGFDYVTMTYEARYPLSCRRGTGILSVSSYEKDICIDAITGQYAISSTETSAKIC